jgi:cytochrome c553
MADGEVCMGICGKCHGDINKAPEPHFPWLSLRYGGAYIGEEDA